MARMQLLNLKSLHQVPNLSENFEDFLAQAVRDCVSRPGLKKNREVCIRVQVNPDQQSPDHVRFEVDCVGKIPSRRSAGYRALATTQGGLKFNPDVPDTPEQGSFDFDQDDNTDT